MQSFDHGIDSPIVFGWALRRYRLGGLIPRLVIDTGRQVHHPSDDGLSLNGCFDIHFDGTAYHGLAAPFIAASIGATLIRAVPSSYDISVDYLLQPGGGRNPAPADGFVPGENDIWSIGV